MRTSSPVYLSIVSSSDHWAGTRPLTPSINPKCYASIEQQHSNKQIEQDIDHKKNRLSARDNPLGNLI